LNFIISANNIVKQWDRTWDKALRGLAENSAIQVDRLIGVYCGQRSYRFEKVEV
jgi:hypothetical protein